MLAMLVSPSRWWWFLGTAWRLAVALQRHLARDVFQHPRHLTVRQSLKHRPVSSRDGHHHPGIGLTNLQYQVVGRQLLAHYFLPMLRTQRPLKQPPHIARQKPQTERKQARFGVAKGDIPPRQRLSRLEEQPLDSPTLAIDFCHPNRRHLLGGQVRQNVDLPVAIPSRLIQHDSDATDLHNLPLLASQPQALFPDPTRLTAALRLLLAQQFTLEVAVLTHDEGTPASQDSPEQSQGAEVAVRYPDLTGVDQRVDLMQQSTFLSVAILAQHYIGDGQVLLVEDHQDQAGQRGGPCSPQLRQAMFGRRQMVAIQEFDPVAGQQRR